MNEELKKRILELSKENLNILDLGFCSPSESFCLFKTFKSKKNKTFFYTGVDICDAFNVFKGNCPHINAPATYEIDSSDWVNNFNGQCCMNLSEEENFTIDEDTFLKHFKFHFQTDIIEYVKSLSSDSHFDIIVLSNILHKIDSDAATFVFEKCLEHLRNEGLIYISVLGIKYKNALVEDKLFSQERYHIMKEKVNVLWCKENEEFHFQFIGSLNTTNEGKKQGRGSGRREADVEKLC